MRGSQLLQLVPSMLCVIAAGVIYRQGLGSATSFGWRRHAAASIPAIYTLLLLLIWVLPIQFFLVSIFDPHAFIPILALTFLGVVVASCLPSGYFRLRRREADGRIYAGLGVRRFRSVVTNGDQMVRLMKRIDPQSRAGLKNSTLAERETRTRRTEKIHWALLLGSLPAAVWAMVMQEAWFALYLLAANVPMNVYPILLQRHTRARLARIRERVSSAGKNEAA